MKRVCFVATIPEVIHTFLRGHIQAAAGRWQVTVVCHPAHAELLQDLNVQFVYINFQRKIAPFRDLLALIRLAFLFRQQRFDLVHSIMPKTGLLAMAAAWLARVPHRLHTFTGQVWANKTGLHRSILKFSDRVIASLATRIIVDSPSQRDFLQAEGVLGLHKGQVLGKGSICGVDTRRFKPDAAVRQQVRHELQITERQIALLFVGRINTDKGIPELVQAFIELAELGSDLVLVLVGEEEDIRFAQIQEMCGPLQRRLRVHGYTRRPERYMNAADIFCLPSHREGFGQVIIEAAACAVPVVATAIYGIRDAVADGATGLLFQPGDRTMLKQQLLQLIDDAALRQRMGQAAQQRVNREFSYRAIMAEMMAVYEELLGRQ